MGHPQSDEEEGDCAGSGVAEVAGARPEKVSCDCDRQQHGESGTGTEDLQSDLAVNAGDGETAPGCSPEGGVLHSFEEYDGMEEVCREEQEKRHETSGGPDGEGRASAYGRQVEQKGESQRYDNDHGELGADCDRYGDAQQNDAAPVPENNFARRVERMSDGDSGEDGSEGSPSGEDFRFGVPYGAGLDHGRRKAVESEGKESARVSAETAGNIPQGSAEEEPAGQERQAREPAPVRGEGELVKKEALGPGKQRGCGYE